MSRTTWTFLAGVVNGMVSVLVAHALGLGFVVAVLIAFAACPVLGIGIIAWRHREGV